MSKNTTKQVTFFPRVAVQIIANKDTFEPDEKNATWYSQAELESIRIRCREIVAASCGCTRPILATTDDNGDGICTRGLESSIGGCENRNLACAAVLREQSTQKAEGVDDHDDIAEIYASFSVTSQRLALLRGIQDQKAARSGVLNRNIHEEATPQVTLPPPASPRTTDSAEGTFASYSAAVRASTAMAMCRRKPRHLLPTNFFEQERRQMANSFASKAA